jgi:uncharacterized protein YggE
MLRAAVAFLVLPVLLSPADAQLVGARADRESVGVDTIPTLDQIENYIAIEGKVEKRLDPTALRIVFALMVEQPTASECQAECGKREEAFLKALHALDVARDQIVVDFISILPAYAWEIETRQSERVAVERKSGFRMQSNVHVQVATEKEARAVLEAAFKLDISDVIAFDYWNEHVDRTKKEARAEALRVAKEKADLLLGSLFEKRPQPLNVHESTRVVYPRSLYDSFENVYAQQGMFPSTKERIPRLSAARPKNTYYRGLMEASDVQGPNLALRPQISVVSTVRLYYATPGAKKGKKDSKE